MGSSCLDRVVRTFYNQALWHERDQQAIPSLVVECLNYRDEVSICHFHFHLQLTIDWKKTNMLLNLGLAIFGGGGWGRVDLLLSCGRNFRGCRYYKNYT